MTKRLQAAGAAFQQALEIFAPMNVSRDAAIDTIENAVRELCEAHTEAELVRYALNPWPLNPALLDTGTPGIETALVVGTPENPPPFASESPIVGNVSVGGEMSVRDAMVADFKPTEVAASADVYAKVATAAQLPEGATLMRDGDGNTVYDPKEVAELGGLKQPNEGSPTSEAAKPTVAEEKPAAPAEEKPKRSTRNK